MHTKARVYMKPMLKSQSAQVNYDMSRTENILGYSPSTDLKDGITTFLKWLSSYEKRKKQKRSNRHGFPELGYYKRQVHMRIL